MQIALYVYRVHCQPDTGRTAVILLPTDDLLHHSVREIIGHVIGPNPATDLFDMSSTL